MFLHLTYLWYDVSEEGDKANGILLSDKFTSIPILRYLFFQKKRYTTTFFITVLKPYMEN